MKRTLARRGLDHSKCVIIPNAIDVKSLRNQFHSISKGLSEPEFDLLFVGRLEERKGIINLLKSIILLHKKEKKYTLKIIGHGPLQQALFKMISENNLTKYVKLLGYVPKKELLKCYLLSKVVVIPSSYEGLPTVALEAMVANKPLIVSNIHGLNELVLDGGNGYIVAPTDIQGLATAIDRIFTDPNSFSSLNDINDKVLARFDWSTVANKILMKYHSTLINE
jgi:glycosyltransferase involved in cell wall biosynthesis